jgi:hypothetical protein
MSEDDLQRAVIAHWRAYPVPGSVLAAIPNGEWRSKATAGRLKALGVYPGFPDLFALGNDAYAARPGLGPRVALIELKRPTLRARAAERDLSAAQKELLPLLRAGGVEVLVSNDLDEVLGFLKGMGVLRG